MPRHGRHQRVLAGFEIQLAVSENPVHELKVRGAIAIRAPERALDCVQFPSLILRAQRRLLVLTEVGVLLATAQRAGRGVKSGGSPGARHGGGSVERPRGREAAVLMDPLVRGEHVPGVAPRVVPVAVN